MRVVLDFKDLSERDIENYLSYFNWKSWSYYHLNEELSIEVELKDFFPSEVLERLKSIEIEELELR